MPAGNSKRPDPVTAVTPLEGPTDPTGTASKGMCFLLKSTFTAYSRQALNTRDPNKLEGPV